MPVQNNNTIFYYLLAIGISLTTFVIRGLPVPISITDITILILLLYSMIIYQRVIFSLMMLFVLLFALDIFIANIINYYFEPEFSLEGFFTNYIRIIAIVLITLLIPSLTKEFDLYKLCRAILFAVKVHCIIVILDPLVAYPWSFMDDGGIVFSLEANSSLPSVRGRGLFEEPSFFAAYVGLMFSFVLQYQRNSRKVVSNYWDYLIIFLGLVASASVTGIAVMSIILVQLFFIYRKKFFSSNIIFKTIGVTVISIPILALLLASSLSFVSERLSSGLSGGSSLQRLAGSTYYFMDVLRERPFTGVGLGGKNQQLFLDKYGDPFVIGASEFLTINETQVLEQSATTFWAALIGAGGIPLLFIFYFLILGTLILNKRTFYVGVMIFFLGVSKGGVFELNLWWVIASAVSFYYLKPLPQNPSNLIKKEA